MTAFRPINPSELPDGVWRIPVPIRFGHCDPAGIVYTPEYFNIFNGVLEDWYGACLGIPYHVLISHRRTGLGYAHVSADFATPGRLGQVMEVAVVVTAIGRSSVTLTIHAFNDMAECVRATFITVITSLDTHRSMPIPDDLRTALEAYQARSAPSAAEAG